MGEVLAQRRLTLVHVRGHTGQRWNEHADALDKRGAAGEVGTAGRWGQRAMTPRRLSAGAAPSPRLSPIGNGPVVAAAPAAPAPAVVEAQCWPIAPLA
eukprot:15471663-Alexandrium_andersonii.AAC.1